MNRLYVILILLFPIISFNGCDEDELDKPTNVQFKVSMEELEISDGKNLKIGKPMQIDDGRIAIESIEFDGTRENAKDYYFSRSFEKGLIGDLGQNKLNMDVTFDIPQGSYHPARISLQLGTVDSLSPIVLYGTYNHPTSEETQVEFRFSKMNNEPIEIELKIENTKGDKKVLFKKGKTKTLNIEVNLNPLFARFNPGTLNSATITQEGSTRKIIISPNQNEEMYNELIDRIGIDRIDKLMKAVLK